MEYWHETITQKSWNALQGLKTSGFDFILIGGWAAYLWTRSSKSKDIDIIVDMAELGKIKGRFDLKKNDNLKKYEIKIDEIDIDIYVPYYSKLALPVEEIRKYATKVEGFAIVRPEILLILKQAAELDRGESEKGMKDRVDIISLLIRCQIDMKLYLDLIRKYKLENYFFRLKTIVKNFKEHQYLNLNTRELKIQKARIMKAITKV